MELLDFVLQFLNKYFIEPMVYGEGYNPVNTSVFIFLLFLTLVLIYKLFVGLRIPIDRSLGVGSVPYVFLGSSLRVLKDAGVLHSIIFVSPFIFILTGLIAISFLVLSIKVEERIGLRPRLLWFVFGLSLAVLVSTFFQGLLKNFQGPILILVISGLSSLFIFLLNLRGSTNFLSRENCCVISAHIFDSTTTFVGVDFYGYVEQHFLPRFLIGLTGTAAVMYPLKLTAVLLFLFIIDFGVKSKLVRKGLKLSAFILGLATGTRNLLRIACGV